MQFLKFPPPRVAGVATGNRLLPSDLCWCDGTSCCEQRAVWVYCADVSSTESSSSNTREAAIRQTAERWGEQGVDAFLLLLFTNPDSKWSKYERATWKQPHGSETEQKKLETDHLNYRWVTPFSSKHRNDFQNGVKTFSAPLMVVYSKVWRGDSGKLNWWVVRGIVDSS